MQSFTRYIKRCLSLLWMVRNSPSQLALGLTLGFGLGILPKDNLIAVLLAMGLIYFPANAGCALLALSLGLLIGPGLDGVTHSLGRSMLTVAPLKSLLSWSYHQPILPWLGLHNTVVMGTTLLLCIVSPIQYLTCRKFFTVLRRVAIQNQVDRVVLESKRYQRSLIAMRDRPNSIDIGIATQESSMADTAIVESPVESLDDALLADFVPFPFVEEEPVESFREESAGPRMGEPVIRIDLPEVDPLLPSGSIEKREERVSVTIGGSETASRASAAVTNDSNHSQMLRPGLRVDLVQDEGTDVPPDRFEQVSTQSPELPSISAVAALSETLQLGDILRETLIEVVRFRAATTSQQDRQDPLNRPDFAEKGSSASSADSVGLHPEQDPLSSPLKEFAYPMHVQTRPSVPMNPVRVENSVQVAPTKPEETTPAPLVPPAEESLRYLLWHLSSLNRESKQ